MIWGTGLLVLFLALPLVAMAWRALAEWESITPAAAATLRQAITLSLLTTGIAMVAIVALGTPLAYLLARRSFRGSRVIDVLVDLPVVLPPAVAGIALLIAFGRYGVVGRWLNEAGITVMFAGNFPGVTQTMPLAIYGRFGAGDLPSALLLSIVLLRLSMGVLLGLRRIGERSHVLAS